MVKNPQARADFYPRPPRGGRPAAAMFSPPSSCHFYPRPPRGGRRGDYGKPAYRPAEFLPTPSARRATSAAACLAPSTSAISTHALREEGDRIRPQAVVSARAISTHALREEGDPCRTAADAGLRDFYPRPPRGGRQGMLVLLTDALISTHALREEGDLSCGRATA